MPDYGTLGLDAKTTYDRVDAGVARVPAPEALREKVYGRFRLGRG